MDSFNRKDADPNNYEFDWRNDGYFMVSLIITIANVLLVLLILVIHKLFWEKGYRKVIEGAKNKNLIKETWGNEACDKAF